MSEEIWLSHTHISSDFYSDAQLAEPYPRLLLVDGNRMAKVYFYQNPDGYTVSVEQWSQIFAAQLGK